MAFKIFVLAALVAAVQAGVVAPLAAKVVDTEYDPNPQYTYAYDVQDSLTGDSKNQFETRNGDIVQGRYSLIEADGTRRIVDYTADPINGFNAVVQREPLVAKVVAPAPVAVAKYAAPVVAAAPVAKVVAPAPVALPAFARYAAPVFAPAPAAVPAFAKFAAPVALPAVAKVAAPLVAASPYSYPVAAKVAAPLVAPAPFAKLAYPAPLAYSAPIASPYAKVVSPFGYPAAYSTVF